MDSRDQNTPRNPRRRPRDPKRVFKEVYLPVIVAAGVLVLIVLIIILAVSCGSDLAEKARKESLAAEESRNAAIDEEISQATRLRIQAQALYDSYDYEGALELLDSFGTRLYDHEGLVYLRDDCERAMESLIAHSGDDVVHLSVQVLIADAGRAFADKDYGNGFKKNFITTDEFRNLLDQLYTRGYVLIDMADIVDESSDDAGNMAFSEKSVMLPPGKKPLMLTQTQVNYYTYMVDPDEDGVPDKNGAGFASRLLYQNGQFINEMVDSDGNTVTGSFDLVPILEEFIELHPDFSYKGARPTLAVTGYNGIFGYRGDTLADAAPLVEALKERGYTIAYYTYYNSSYTNASAEKITDEGERWNKNIVPVLGQTSYMVYALSGDIAKPDTVYSGEQYSALRQLGMRYFFGFCSDGDPWFMVDSTHVRMGRILANAENLSQNPEWFDGICDPASVLMADR